MEKCNQIRKIFRIRQMLRRWRKNASSGHFIPLDVPAGHVAISVGSGHRRFVVRAAYLNHPVFKKLLAQAEEEYGFINEGPLAIPCEESVFLESLRVVARSESGNSARVEALERCLHMGFRKSRDSLSESRPLLHG